jgi:hypothetical protein
VLPLAAALLSTAASPAGAGSGPGQATPARPGAKRSGGSAADANSPVALSRASILESGVSATYFDAHFKLVRLIEKPGDLRVVWKYAVNGYETTLTDSVGYYTAENQRRVQIHSIKESLGAAREITKTVPRQKARDALRECLGKYTGESVMLTRLGHDKGAALYLTAHTASATGRSEEEREKEREREKAREREPAQKAAASKKSGQPAGPPPPSPRPSEGEDEEKERAPIYIGYVNLETGKCTKLKAAASP